MVTISGIVIFSGLSSQFDFNSDVSAFKTNLDAIRIEQSKLKGHAVILFECFGPDSERRTSEYD